MLGYSVPLAMATQHPDSASRGFTAEEEVDEAVQDLLPYSMGGFGLDEKMVDYEGKLTPYHQAAWIVEKLVGRGLIPGEDFLITPRIPTEKLEEPERQIMVLWGVVVANKKSIAATGRQAIRYIINPMSSTGYEVYVVQRRILKVQRLAEEELGAKMEPLQVIPLLEDFNSLIHADKILESMRVALLKNLGLHYTSYSVLLGKSDTALAYGHLASSLALVYALSRLARWAEAEGVTVHPILGVGALPFRGHLAPHSVHSWCRQYSGYATATIQSGLRFDMGRDATRRVVEVLREHLHSKPRILDPSQERIILKLARILAREYLTVIVRIADRILQVAAYIPRRRARLSPGEYPRSLSESIAFTGDKTLLEQAERLKGRPFPRAITFTAALYTMGLPPSLIGLGRGIRQASRKLGEGDVESVLRELLPLLPLDIVFDLQFYSIRIAERYLDAETLQLIREDVEIAESYTSHTPDPNPEYISHLETAYQLIKAGLKEPAEKAIAEAGAIRGSLG